MNCVVSWNRNPEEGSVRLMFIPATGEFRLRVDNLGGRSSAASAHVVVPATIAELTTLFRRISKLTPVDLAPSATTSDLVHVPLLMTDRCEFGIRGWSTCPRFAVKRLCDGETAGKAAFEVGEDSITELAEFAKTCVDVLTAADADRLLDDSVELLHEGGGVFRMVNGEVADD